MPYIKMKYQLPALQGRGWGGGSDYCKDMIIAKKLKDQNIAEYLLYMWQVEDILRGAGLDVDKLEDTYLSRFQLEGEQKAELRQWYEELAEMMRSEGIAEKGHLQICKNVLIWLEDLHRQLLRSPKFPIYSAAYYKALPFIVELRAKNKDMYKVQSTKYEEEGPDTKEAEEKSEIENCFDALYGLMLLRLQGKPVSEETQRAMESISKFIALLTDYYHKDKKEGLEL